MKLAKIPTPIGEKTRRKNEKARNHSYSRKGKRERTPKAWMGLIVPFATSFTINHRDLGPRIVNNLIQIIQFNNNICFVISNRENSRTITQGGTKRPIRPKVSF